MTHDNQIKVWDLFVRLFHWSLVLFFVISYLTGDELDEIHAYSGYAILVLITLRLIWGLVGSKYARFSQFIYSPATTIDYAKNVLKGNAKRYIGHNPLGGWMVIALLSCITLTGVTGLMVYGEDGHGPLAKLNNIELHTPNLISDAQADDHEHEGKEDDDDENEWLEDIHEFFANFSLFLVLLHIGGVLFSSIHEKQNLPRAMIHGYKRSDDSDENEN